MVGSGTTRCIGDRTKAARIGLEGIDFCNQTIDREIVFLDENRGTEIGKLTTIVELMVDRKSTRLNSSH